MKKGLQPTITLFSFIFLQLLFFISPCFSQDKNFTYFHGAIIRGDTHKKEIALVFAGDMYGDGGKQIIQVLKDENIKASFFFTGNFYRNKNFANVIKTLKSDHHYLGAHSDKHILCCDWKNRDTLLISKAEFTNDVLNNYNEMKKFGISFKDAKYFLPAFEWHNNAISKWLSEMGLILINYTPGTRSNDDYTTPAMKDYISSTEIQKRILDYESKHTNGLNGFILLFHIGTFSKRQDPFYWHLKYLIDELKKRNYTFVTVDKLLSESQTKDKTTYSVN